MRISDWSSDVCSSDLPAVQATNLDFRPENFAWAADGRGFLVAGRPAIAAEKARIDAEGRKGWLYDGRIAPFVSIRPQVRGTFPMEYFHVDARTRSEEHTSELQSLMRTSYAVSRLKNKTPN